MITKWLKRHFNPVFRNDHRILKILPDYFNTYQGAVLPTAVHSLFAKTPLLPTFTGKKLLASFPASKQRMTKMFLTYSLCVVGTRHPSYIMPLVEQVETQRRGLWLEAPGARQQFAEIEAIDVDEDHVSLTSVSDLDENDGDDGSPTRSASPLGEDEDDGSPPYYLSPSDEDDDVGNARSPSPEDVDDYCESDD